MRKLSLIFPVLILASFLGGCFIKEAMDADETSKKFVDENIPKICANLTKENLFIYSVDELKTSLSPEDLDRMFKVYSRLGKFKEYISSKGSATINYDENGKSVTAEYVSETSFENGTATIETKLVKKNNEWKIFNFNVKSGVFLLEEKEIEAREPQQETPQTPI